MSSVCVDELWVWLGEVLEGSFLDFQGEKMLMSFVTLVDLILRLNVFCFRCRFLIFAVTVLLPSDHLKWLSLMVAVSFVDVAGHLLLRPGSVEWYVTIPPLGLQPLCSVELRYWVGCHTVVSLY